jgi:hypothetical protein
MGIIIPGLVLIFEGMILVRGWYGFLDVITHINGIGLTLFILLAFAVGNLTQELGDVCMRAIKGKRYAREGRDNFWLTDEAKIVRVAIKKESELDIDTVDMAYDYCLTRIGNRFPKRDLFVAVSDMCRSLVALSAVALIPAIRVSFRDVHPIRCAISVFVILTALFLATGLLAWKRMIGFRNLSEITVFRVYLAASCKPANNPQPKNAKEADDDDD